MVQFGYTILYVADVERTMCFYEEAFGFTRKFITPEQDYGQLITGETTLAFASLALGNDNLGQGAFQESTLTQKPFGLTPTFVTTEVAHTMKLAETLGATVLQAPTEKPWGQTVGYLRDLDGFLLEICSPIS